MTKKHSRRARDFGVLALWAGLSGCAGALTPAAAHARDLHHWCEEARGHPESPDALALRRALVEEDAHTYAVKAFDRPALGELIGRGWRPGFDARGTVLVGVVVTYGAGERAPLYARVVEASDGRYRYVPHYLSWNAGEGASDPWAIRQRAEKYGYPELGSGAVAYALLGAAAPREKGQAGGFSLAGLVADGVTWAFTGLDLKTRTPGEEAPLVKGLEADPAVTAESTLEQAAERLEVMLRALCQRPSRDNPRCAQFALLERDPDPGAAAPQAAYVLLNLGHQVSYEAARHPNCSTTVRVRLPLPGSGSLAHEIARVFSEPRRLAEIALE